MKRLTKVVKIIAIVLNAIFLAIILLIVSRSGAHPQTLIDWAGFILIFVFPPVTLITIALTFHKKLEILTSVLKVIAIIVNVSFLTIFIFEVADAHFVNLVMWLVCLMGLGLPIVNILAVALTFRKGKAEV
ncbi:MAG TPA: hypothetical protein HPP66_03135 [Planctomycetes bacterium]|nr:hypothetical protein [Planctomycetota bacterium]